MNEYKAVYTVSMMIQAMAVRYGLEQAGISSKVVNTQDAYQILVPATQLFNADNLLFPLGHATGSRSGGR
jgi:hypothetical protein